MNDRMFNYEFSLKVNNLLIYMVSFQFPTQSQSQLYELVPHCQPASQPMQVPCYTQFLYETVFVPLY